MSASIAISYEAEAVRGEVRKLLTASFPTPAEADLVERLRADHDLLLALIAWDASGIAGYVAFSQMHAPFVAVDANATGKGQDQSIAFVTNVEDEVTAGPDHPIRVARDPETGEPSPYVLVRANLEALIDRKTFYRLIDLGTHEKRDGESWFGLWSGGQFFPVIPSAELA